jgi:hypothetical protein
VRNSRILLFLRPTALGKMPRQPNAEAVYGVYFDSVNFKTVLRTLLPPYKTRRQKALLFAFNYFEVFNKYNETLKFLGKGKLFF